MTTRLFGAAIVAILLTACSKTSSNHPTSSSVPVGTFRFTTKDTVFNWSVISDTNSLIYITATGRFPGAADTAEMVLVLSNTLTTSYYPAATQMGTFSDTTDINHGLFLYPSISHDGNDYRDDDAVNANPAPSATYPCVLTITSNDGKTMTGTYSGMMFNQNTPGDTILMTNGAFSVKLAP